MTAPAMPIAALEEITQELLQELHAGDPVEGITRAQAMMVAATGIDPVWWLLLTLRGSCGQN